MQDVGDTHDTPRSSAFPLPSLGLGTIDQLEPDQDNTRVRGTPDMTAEKPTAVELLFVGQLMAVAALLPEPRLGLALTLQAPPLLDSIRLWVIESLLVHS